ncbi:DUF6286 domain-containing protein [Allosalinactinospora lopnorensis]|uniref:DUF6286 domain-containing protein n=1 Tax=Allosalinactinospora lopnorensis TaxID=1352348 RepID=UPI000623D700|nr:DUF6286 domain-containing protein [Allosalinactinospora lopnorensis]
MTTVEDVLGRPEPATVRRAHRVAVRTFRPRRSWPELIIGVPILVLAGVAAAEVISGLAGHPLRLLPFEGAAGYTGEARWSDPPVQGASVMLAVVGLALIVLALLPGRAPWTAPSTDAPDLVVGLERSALRRALTAAAHDVDGVRSACVSVGRRRVHVRVRTEPWSSASPAEDVTRAVERRLAALGPLRALKVSTRVRQMKA